MSVDELVVGRPDPSDAAAETGARAPQQWSPPDPATVVQMPAPGSRPNGSRPNRSLSLIRSNAKGLALLGITSAFVLGAVYLFPHDEQVDPISTVQSVQVFSPVPVSLLVVEMQPLKHGGTTVDLFVNVSETMTAMNHSGDDLFAWILVPQSAWGSTKACAAHQRCTANFDGKDVEVPFYFDAHQPDGYATLHASVSVPSVGASGYGAAANAEYLGAALPEIDVFPVDASQPPMTTPVHVQYGLGSANKYWWTSGANPRRLNSLLEWDELAPAQPAFETGISLARESLDDRQTFIAGALLGVAGAFLAAAIDELHSGPRARARALARARMRARRRAEL